MDADYLVEADGDHLDLILEAAARLREDGAPRDCDYNPALAVLLSQAGQAERGFGRRPG
jgi:hypothetical protein